MKVPKYPIALHLSSVVALLIIFARHVVQAMTNNAWFPTPSPLLATVSANVDALEDAQVIALSKAKGAAAVRDVKRKVVEDDLKALKAYVYGIASLNIGQAIVIILSAGMTPVQFPKRMKAELEARMGPAPLEVILRAKAVTGKRASYEWQFSADLGKSWIAAGTTTVADTSIQGLTAGATYLFRFRTTVRRTTGDWSQVVSFLVH